MSQAALLKCGEASFLLLCGTPWIAGDLREHTVFKESMESWGLLFPPWNHGKIEKYLSRTTLHKEFNMQKVLPWGWTVSRRWNTSQATFSPCGKSLFLLDFRDSKDSRDSWDSRDSVGLRGTPGTPWSPWSPLFPPWSTRFVRIISGKMSLHVSLPSIRGRNEWFLEARLMVSWQIKVIDTVMNGNKLKWRIREVQSREE
jgi:hypothetical protein